jgi:hypothetical protein
MLPEKYPPVICFNCKKNKADAMGFCFECLYNSSLKSKKNNMKKINIFLIVIILCAFLLYVLSLSQPKQLSPRNEIPYDRFDPYTGNIIK